MKANREDVIQAALVVERWCREHFKAVGGCDCPFYGERIDKMKFVWPFCVLEYPSQEWNLEEFLRNRGLKHD